MMGNESAAVEEEEAVPEHLRCSRTNGGKSWRCPRRVVGNMKRCEFHRLQDRQYNKGCCTVNMMGKESAMEEEEEAVPEHLRCSRTDGKKKWRCPRRVVENMKRCEFHSLKDRLYKESLKLQMEKKPKLSSAGNHVNVNDMEGEGEGEDSSTVVDITGYDLRNRIYKLEKLIAKLKADKLSSKV